MEKPRFIVPELYQKPSDQVLNFKPGLDGYDEFGNRGFSSQFSFKNRDGEIYRAVMVVSNEGKEFILTHRGILRQIDLTLQDIAKRRPWQLPDEIKITPERTLHYLGSGSSSNAFTLQTEMGKFILNINETMSAEFPNLAQPYISEMLQMQTVQKALRVEFENIGLRFPRFYFASPFVSCEEFVKSNEARIAENKAPEILRVIRRMHEYIKGEQMAENKLWEKINLDLSIDRNRLPDLEFVGNELVWIDPFFYDPYLK